MSKINAISIDDFEPDFFYDVQEGENTPPALLPPKEYASERQIPLDKDNFVYNSIYLLGISSMLPWCFFVTCNDYWMYRFRDLHQNDSSHNVALLFDSETNRTKLQADFTAYISIASTVPSTFFLFFNIFYLRKFSTHWRILSSAVLILLCFIATTILVLIDTDSWQFSFFILTIATVIVINMATAMLQAAVCGIIMKFPVAYISAFSSGQSLAGIFAAVALLMTLLVNNLSATQSTFVYFVIGDIVILFSFIGYIISTQTEYYLYFTNDVIEDSGSTGYHRIETYSQASILNGLNILSIYKKVHYLIIGIFLCYIVTSSIYPAIAVLVCSMNIGRHSLWSERYFVPVVTYLLYCVCDYIGRITAGIIQRPKGRVLVLISFLRFGFIPLLMLCNAQPRHHLPVLIDSDWIYSLILVGLAFSNGYIACLTFVLIPESVLDNEQEVASNVLVIALCLSLSIGCSLSFPLINLL